MPLMNGSAAALAEVTPRRLRVAVLFGVFVYSYAVDIYARISNLIQTSRPSGGLERLYS